MRGRTVHEDNAVVTVPLLPLPGVVLVPGQVIPLHLFQQQLIAMLRRLADTDHTFGVVTYRLVLQMHAMIPMGLAPFQLPVESVSVSLESVAKSLWVAFSQFLCGICPRECCQESLGCLFAVPLWNLSQRVLPRVSGLPFCSSPVESVLVSLESVAKNL